MSAHPSPALDTPGARVLSVVTVVVLLLNALAAPAGAQVEPAHEPPVRTITFPVVGPVDFDDTFGACRGVNCSRRHQGVDVFTVRLTPLVAAVDGRITSIRRSGLTNAGNTIIIRDDEGWRYLYLHLNNDSPGTDDGANTEGWIIPSGLKVGHRVTEGQVIGYLGDSGNAERTPAHLHFEIHQPGVGAINPTASLVTAKLAGREVPVSDLASTAEGRAEHEPVIAAWYRALLRREPTDMELFAWADRFAIGLGDLDDLIADLTMHPQRRGPSGVSLRAYQVALDRRPTIVEHRAVEEAWRGGQDAEAIVGTLLDGPEFADTYGVPTDAAFIEIIYRNARGRAPAERVRQYWLGQLASGRPRADMAEYFVGSSGLRSAMWHDLEVIQAYRAALDRFPTDREFDHYVGHLDRDGYLILDVVEAIRG